MMDEQSRKVPLSMSMDLALLRRLDALRGQTTRSAFVRSIITEYVDAREPEVKGQRKLTDKPGDDGKGKFRPLGEFVRQEVGRDE